MWLECEERPYRGQELGEDREINRPGLIKEQQVDQSIAGRLPGSDTTSAGIVRADAQTIWKERTDNTVNNKEITLVMQGPIFTNLTEYSNTCSARQGLKLDMSTTKCSARFCLTLLKVPYQSPRERNER